MQEERTMKTKFKIAKSDRNMYSTLYELLPRLQTATKQANTGEGALSISQ